MFQALNLKLEEKMVGSYQILTRLMEICLTNGLHTTGLKLATPSVNIFFYSLLFLYATFIIFTSMLTFREGSISGRRECSNMARRGISLFSEVFVTCNIFELVASGSSSMSSS